jgi:hypothetical protein
MVARALAAMPAWDVDEAPWDEIELELQILELEAEAERSRPKQ